ncbi:hypothetical protein K438DRAFT_780078 [Mycena galopus ATCC 62051]|nr:hypothetical protein K438DRAFT_780078 [Mycena galopus ATCC 62051]
MTGFTVHNRSNEIIFVTISNKTGASDAEYEIKSFEQEGRGRSGWEDVTIRNKANTRRTALWVNRGGPAIIHFDGFDKPLTIFNDYRPDPGFIINNLSPRYVLPLDQLQGKWLQTFVRNGWEAIGIKSEDGKHRTGQFLDNDGKRITVDFLGFDEEFILHPGPDDFIAEHYAEAIRIADHSYAGGKSRASLPGGRLHLQM